MQLFKQWKFLHIFLWFFHNSSHVLKKPYKHINRLKNTNKYILLKPLPAWTKTWMLKGLKAKKAENCILSSADVCLTFNCAVLVLGLHNKQLASVNISDDKYTLRHRHLAGVYGGKWSSMGSCLREQQTKTHNDVLWVHSCRITESWYILYTKYLICQQQWW